MPNALVIGAEKGLQLGMPSLRKIGVGSVTKNKALPGTAWEISTSPYWLEFLLTQH